MVSMRRRPDGAVEAIIEMPLRWLASGATAAPLESVHA
jgi:hypothetical protein